MDKRIFFSNLANMLKHSFFLLAALYLSLVGGCRFGQGPSQGTLETTSGKVVQIRLAITPLDQTKGLSGTKSMEFKADEGMLFFNLKDDYRRFWMPDTYFNLDIFFLDEKLKVLSVERNVPAHPGSTPVENIATTDNHFCRHVLEMKADSPLSQEIKVGDVLKWTSSPSLLQIESKIRSQQ